MLEQIVADLRRNPDAFQALLSPSASPEARNTLLTNLDRLFAANPPLRETWVPMIRRFLSENPAAFHQLYAELSKRGPIDWTGNGVFSAEENRKISELAAELREQGMGVWRGMFKDQVEALRELAIEPLGRAKAYLHSGKVSKEGTPKWDDEMSCEFWGRDFTHKYGRSRAFYRNGASKMAPPLRAHVDDARVHEVGRRCFGADVANGGALLEFLEPAPATGDWHIDKIMDQFKIMVLLDDVKEENGAMRVKPGTLGLWSSKLKPMYHSIFVDGNEWCGVSEPLAQNLPQPTIHCTGKAGDTFFFDTMCLHTASQCTEGYRLVAVHYYTVMNRKNAVLRELGVR